MSSVPFEELKKIPYLDYVPHDGRTIFSQPYFNANDKTFKIFIPQADKIIWLFAEPFESCYYAENNLNESTDIYLSIVDIIGRHYSFGSVLQNLISIIRDVLNCGVAVEKYFIFLDRYRNTKDVISSSLVATELEYFFGNLRSLYDLLQNVIKDLWMRSTGKKLPESFSRMVSKGNLEQKYGLPNPLVTYYNNTKGFFNKCCTIRDNIYHRGLDVQAIFCIEDGFALQKDSIFPSPFVSEFDSIWPQEKIKKNGLVSVLALMAYANKEMLENFNMLSQALVQTIRPLPSISEKCRLFLRSPFAHHLIRSEKYVEEQWILPADK